MARLSTALVCVLALLGFFSPVQAQPGGGMGGGAGGGSSYTLEILDITKVSATTVNVKYSMDDDYSGGPNGPQMVMLRHGIQTNVIPVDVTEGEHNYNIELGPNIFGYFEVKIHYDTDMYGNPKGLSQGFYIDESGTLTLYLPSTYIGTTGITSSPDFYQGSAGNAVRTHIYAQEQGRGNSALTGQEVPVISQFFPLSGGGEVCSASCGTSPPPADRQQEVTTQVVCVTPQAFALHSNFSPGFMLPHDSSGYLFESDVDGLGFYFSDAGAVKWVTFFDVIGSSGSDGIMYDEDNRYVDARVLDSSDATTSDLSQAAKVVVSFRNGVEETYELFDADDTDDTGDKNARLTKRTYPNGREETLSYSSKYKISTITYPSGDTYTFSYGAQQSGRDAVSSITLPNSEVVSFSYSGGFLSQIDAGDTQWNCSITDDSIAQTTNLNITSTQGDRTVYVTQDYIELDGDLVNQPTNILRGIENGDGENVLAVFQNPSDSSEFLLWRGTDYLARYTLGMGVQYCTSWTLGDPADGWNAFTNKVYESSYAVNGLFDNGTAMGLGAPQTTTRADGTSLTNTYDSDYYLTKLTYPDSTFDEFDYDSDHRVTRYRDRFGRVLKYVYDSSGNMTQLQLGILDTGTSDVNQSEYAVWQFEYNSLGYVTKIKDPLYNGSYTDLHLTEFVYDTSNRLTQIKQAADQTSGARPTTYFTYGTDGYLATKTDPVGRVTTYTFDVLGRNTEVEFHDGSTEQTLYGNSTTGHESRVIKRKDRADTVTTYSYDDSGRVTGTVVGAAIDADILDGQADDTTISDPTKRISTTYYYVDGTQLVSAVVVNGKRTDYEYDYRGRPVSVTRYPHSSGSLETVATFQNNRLFSVADPYGRKKFFGYGTDGSLERIIAAAVPSVSYANNTAVLAASRSLTENATQVIVDVDVDYANNEVTTTDTEGIDSVRELDSIGRTTGSVAADGTSIAARTEMDYDLVGSLVALRGPRSFDSGDSAYGTTLMSATYNGRNLLDTQTAAPSTSVAASTSVEYTEDGRVDTVTDQLGEDWIKYWPLCCGTMSGMKDPLGHGAIFNADSAGRIAHVIGVEDYSTHTTPSNPTDSKTLSEETVRFDLLGRVIAQTSWLSPRGTIDPDNVPIAGLDGVSASLGVTTQIVYDTNLADGSGLDGTSGVTLGKLGGGTFAVDLNDCLSKLAATTANGGAGISFNGSSAGTGVVYVNEHEELSFAIADGLGRVVMKGVIEPHDGTSPNDLSVWTCYSYDNVVTHTIGDVVENRKIDPLGKVTKVQVDGLGRALARIDQLGKTSSFKYSPAGLMTESRDPNGVGVDIVYDDLGRPTSIEDTYGDEITREYDKAGNLIELTDAKLVSTAMAYDVRNRLSSVTDRESGVTTYQYGASSLVTSMEDAESQETVYEYDERGQRVKTTYPDHVASSGVGTSGYGIVEQTYDPLGRPKLFTAQTGATIDLTYDLAGRVTQRDYRTAANSPSGTIADSDTFTYDAASRLLSAVSGRYSNSASFTYDELGRRASESLQIGGQTYTTSLDYNSRWLLSKITYPDASYVERTYTDRGQISTISRGGTNVVTRTYDAGGRLSQSAFNNGVTETWAYRLDNLVSSITIPGVETRSYTYDANKNVTGESISGTLANYGWATGTSGYDDEDRLVNWERADTNDDRSWTLSLVGNWSSYIQNATTENRTYGDAHELTAVGSTSLSYDVKGNLTEDQLGQLYRWDADNQLTAVDTDGDSTDDVTYAYDALGRRVSRTDSSQTTYYAMRGWQTLAEYSASAPTTAAETFVYGSYIDEPIQKIGTGGTVYLHHNRQFSVSALTDTSGNVQERYAYGSHGTPLMFTAAGATRSSSSYGNNRLFTGADFDPEVGLLYLRNRYYSASNGFVSRDPAGYVDGASLYLGYFAEGKIDPSGLGGKIVATVAEDGNFDIYWVDITVSGKERSPLYVGKLDRDSGFVCLNNNRWSTMGFICDEGAAWSWTDWTHFQNDCRRTLPVNPAKVEGDGLAKQALAEGGGLAQSKVVGLCELLQAQGKAITAEDVDKIVGHCRMIESLSWDLLLFYATAPLDLAEASVAVNALKYADEVKIGKITYCAADAPISGFTTRFGTYVRKVDGYKHALDIDHVKAALIEKGGGVVKINPKNGLPYDHLLETRYAMNGLYDRIPLLKKYLSDPNLTAAQRAAIEGELGEISHLLDRAEQILGELAGSVR